jgi:anti-sigma factor RsiW
MAAAVVLACGLSSVATGLIVSSIQSQAQLTDDVVTAHIRALVQGSPIQVASSDSHTVKPWFAGRLDAAPSVRDLSTQGFTLVGGRLDYVAGRNVGTVVYRRRQHVIDVFFWAARGAADAPPHAATRQGYNVLAWTKDGVTYWAVSDLNTAELKELPGLL